MVFTQQVSGKRCKKIVVSDYRRTTALLLFLCYKSISSLEIFLNERLIERGYTLLSGPLVVVVDSEFLHGLV